jgi:cation:H+ antiporter
VLKYLFMAIGFFLVIKGADILVHAASALARRLRVSQLVIGLTVVSFGTSLPELAVNLTASVQGNTGITVGNIIGSNIANILLILGVSGLIMPLTVTKGTVWKEIPLNLLAAIVITIMVNDSFLDEGTSAHLSRTEGLVLLCFFMVFLYYSASIARNNTGMEQALLRTMPGLLRTSLLMVMGFAALIVGSTWVVGGAVKLATFLGVSETIVGLTVVAVGTSLPELATSTVAAYRKNPDIAVGNVIGSNIFNVFFILGFSSVIRPLPLEPRVNIDIGLLNIASIFMLLFMLTGEKRTLDRWEAGLLLSLYLVYVMAIVLWLH